MPFDRSRYSPRRPAPTALLLMGMFLFAAPAGVRAATFTVSGLGDAPGDPTTLRGAVAASEASTDVSDTINITATGTITLSPSGGALAVYNGQGVVGKTLTITGPGAAHLTISGGGQTGVFALSDTGTGGIAVAISGLTVSGGASGTGGAGIVTTQALSLSGVVLSGNTATDSDGGGLFASGAAVSLTNCAVSGNSAAEGSNAVATKGGGLYSSGGSLALSGCTVSGNQSDDFVGGIDNNGGTLVLTDCTVSGNSAGSNTGGIENDGTATLTGCTVIGNTGDNGGGLYSSGTLALTGCTVSGNTAPNGYGGGLFSQPGPDDSLTATGTTFSGNSAPGGGGVFSYVDSVPDTASISTTFTDCTFRSNSALQEGGGVYSYSAASGTDSGPIAAAFTGCTFSGNSTAGDFGGGLYIDSEDTASGAAPLSTTLTNCTVSGNTAPTGGGGLDFYGTASVGSGGPVTPTCVVQSSIIAGNTLAGTSPGPDADIHDDGQETMTSGGSNLIGIGDGDFTGGTGHDQVGTGAAPVAPHLGTLAGNGGAPQTLALLAGSPALDADFHTLTSTDERGLPRPSGLRGDIGAFEHQAPAAAPHAFTTNEGVAETIPAASLTAGSSAPDADAALSVAVATGAAHGAVTQSGGSLTYTPAAGFVGTDSFTYEVNDGVTNSAPATATMTVLSVTPADVTPPVTTAALSPAAPTGGGGYYRQPVTVTLSATDNTSGVAGTFYTVNGGAQQPYTGPFTLSADSVYSVSYHSVDVAGNIETAQTLTVKIDATAPTLTFGTPTPAPNTNGWNNAPVSIPATAADNLSGVASTTPNPVHIVTAGANQALTVTVTDVAGNSRAFQTPAVNIDLTKPVTTAATQGTATGVQVTLSATDDLSGVAGTAYAVDGGAQQPYTGPFTVTGSGPHTVSYFSTDKAGNIESSKTLTFTVNIAAPATTVSLSGPQGNNGYYTGPVTVTLTARSAASRITGTLYTVDGGAQQPYTGPFIVSADQAHVVTYHSTDAAGNVEAAHTLPFKIDGTAPVTTAAASGPQTGGVYTGTVTVSLAATDGFSGVASVQDAVDGGPAQTDTASFTIGTAGAHTVTYFSTDAAGNVEATRTLTFTIQLAAPAPAVAHTFPAGMQMFSVPADYSAVPLGTALSQPAPRLAVWDPALTQYVLSPTSPADALRPGQAYWARFSQATDLYAVGTPTPTDRPFTVTLKKGWNMVGDPFPSAVSLDGVQAQSSGRTFTGLGSAAQAGLVAGSLYSYPAGAGAYQTESSSGGSLAPYVGYWLYAFQDCTLGVPAP